MRNSKFIYPILFFILTFFLASPLPAAERSALADAIGGVQPKVVKIYGAGGFRGLEPYQSGILISPEGHVLTALSAVLEADDLSAVLWDGRKLAATLLGADPRLEIAVLKIEGKDFPYYDLPEAAQASAGTPILALSNLFGVAEGDEPVSVQHGFVSVVTDLHAGRGVFDTLYRGPVYVLDVETNNPGAAGGALVDRRGRLLAMLGKELRNSANHTWLNYAIPIAELRPAVEAIRSGKSAAPCDAGGRKKPQRALRLDDLGLVLVPDVLERTPPYVDAVRPGSPAAKAGLRPDDLVVLLGQRLTSSCRALRAELEYVDYEDEIRLTVERGQELIEVKLRGEGGR
jgi:S1-C subfamily serine protease